MNELLPADLSLCPRVSRSMSVCRTHQQALLQPLRAEDRVFSSGEEQLMDALAGDLVGQIGSESWFK